MAPSVPFNRRNFLAALAVLSGCDEARGEGPPSAASSAPKAVAAARVQPPSRFDELKTVRQKLEPLHTRAHQPKPGEWRAEHPEEGGQSFERYVASRPTTVDEKRKVIAVLPLGPFKPTDRKIIERTAEYLALHFQLEARILADASLDDLPKSARRKHPQWGDPQVLTTHLLNRVLPSQLPGDAAALIAFTASDLWPGGGWNFVFGQADLRSRVGVWSLYRHGDSTKGDDAYRLALLRTLKIAAHETGHMFSLEHCTAYECVQSGVNSLEEADASPLWLCPDCEAKVAWATKSEPLARKKSLQAFCETAGLAWEAAFFARERDALLY